MNRKLSNMPSVTEIQANRSKPEEVNGVPNSHSVSQLRQNSLQHHFARLPKEKTVLPPLPRGSTNTKCQDKARVVKKNTVQSIPLKSSKPWPGSGTNTTTNNTSTKPTTIIKHMSNVPSYLQTKDSGGNFQDKALNFGVLEWGLLEKWTSQQQKTGTATGTVCQSRKSHSVIDNKGTENTGWEEISGEFVFDPSCNMSSFSGELFTGDIHLTDRTPRIPHSCPLPRALFTGDADLHGPGVRCTETKLPITNSAKPGLSQMSRSSSLRERVSDRESQSVVNKEEQPNKRGRQSPLRRMLDPLIKPKTQTSPVKLNPTTAITPSCESNSNKISDGYPNQEQNVQSTRQALLQLAWKNGLPLFMLSSSDSDILAATVRKRGNLDQDNNNYVESTYTIFTVQESKKKGGRVWIKPSNKGKKQLVSNLLGEVRVSSLKSNCNHNPKRFHVSRHFVLVGSELVPRPNGAIIDPDSPVKSELAAIVTRFPQQQSECSCEKGINGRSSVTAILPSGVHGLSGSGEPSPLIERWKSGGMCDCGGWDEGCSLTVLSNEDGHDSSCSTTQRFQLSVQGQCGEEGNAFSMVRFKEGLYTIEFRSSIALLQAFVICIAVIHSQYPTKQEGAIGGLQLQEKIFTSQPSQGRRSQSPARSKGVGPTSYVPYHPPLSPVGRA